MIPIKSPEEIKTMREGGRILARILKEVGKEVKPGVSKEYLDKVASDLVLKYGGQCSFKGYKGFPACLCVSLNDEIVHGIPSQVRIKEGDIVSLDLGILYKGFHTDMAVTVPAGKISPEAGRLIRATKKALKRGIKKARPGATLGDVGSAIQKHIEGQGFSVVRELCGHGVGRDLHEEPEILNYGKRGEGLKLKEGMVLALEPMATMAGWQIKRAKDGYGYATKDGSLSCHFEATIAITKNGSEVLTK